MTQAEVFAGGGTAFTIYPIYLVVDVSESMGWGPAGESPIDALNKEYLSLVSEMKRSPRIRENAQVCVITFNHLVATAVPLGDMDTSIEFFAAGATRFSGALAHTARQIESDAARLSSQGRSFYRPTVFFLTDGRPEPPEEESKLWPAELERLKQARHWPHIFCLGFGQADRSVLARMTNGSGKAYFASQGSTQSEALVKILESIKFSVFSADQTGQLSIDPGDGLTEIRISNTLRTDL
jgi:uncharacterized protein YegL